MPPVYSPGAAVLPAYCPGAGIPP
ncbi:MAG: hypothetical protein K0R13_3234, partial [Propionibacteriaceae bacterium]|nr:hypothetical protein [Propionibacteriaceae bacterium]